METAIIIGVMLVWVITRLEQIRVRVKYLNHKITFIEDNLFKKIYTDL